MAPGSVSSAGTDPARSPTTTPPQAASTSSLASTLRAVATLPSSSASHGRSSSASSSPPASPTASPPNSPSPPVSQSGTASHTQSAPSCPASARSSLPASQLGHAPSPGGGDSIELTSLASGAASPTGASLRGSGSLSDSLDDVAAENVRPLPFWSSGPKLPTDPWVTKRTRPNQWLDMFFGEYEAAARALLGRGLMPDLSVAAALSIFNSANYMSNVKEVWNFLG